jgi:outer membrane receptor protein involved in Fe transport
VANSVTGGFGAIGGATNHNESHRDQLRGDVTLYFGGHEVKAGGDYQNGVTESVSAYSGGQTVYRYNFYGQLFYAHDFIAVSPTDLTPTVGFTAPKTRDYGAFLQDTWRVAPGWTVSAGLRWDGEDIRDYSGATVIKTTLWQPRLGVVWDPKGDGSAKVYAFAGRFGYALPTDLSVRAYGNETFAETYNFDPVNTAQDPRVIGFSRP